jgi:hypothetical protein
MAQGSAVVPGRMLTASVLSAGVLLRLALMLRARGLLIDDAYISLRYGRNFILGRGLVFNPGEHALGTAPLYSCFLGLVWRVCDSLHAAAGVGYVITSLNIGFMAAAALVLLRLLSPESAAAAPAAPPAEAPRSWPAACLAPLTVPFLPFALYALYVPFVDNTVTGMETTSFVLLQLLSLYAVLRRRFGLAAGLLGLVLVVRVEGVLWAGAVLLTDFLKERGPRGRLIYPTLAILAVWAVITTLYYGSPVPLNIMAKSGWLVSGDNGGAGSLPGQVWEVLRTFTMLPTHRGGGPAVFLGPLELTLLLGFACGCITLFRRRDTNLAFAFYFLAAVAFHVAGRGALWPSWYAIPPGLAFYVVFAYGVSSVVGRVRLRPRITGAAAGMLSPALALTLAVVLGCTSVVVWIKIRAPYYRQLEESHGSTGRYLAQHSAIGDSLLVWEVGYISYLADRYTQEVAGIVSPRIFWLRREDPRKAGTLELIARFRPRYLVLPVSVTAPGPGQSGLRPGDRYDLVFTTPLYATYVRADSSRQQRERLDR